MKIWIFAAAIVASAACATAQTPVTAERLVIGIPDPQTTTGAQVETYGVDGGIAIMATGRPFGSESFLRWGNKGIDGNYRKSGSRS